MKVVKEKIAQVPEILAEEDLDLWLLFVRETSLMEDPVLPLLVGHGVTWQSFFGYTRDEQAIALVGNFDEDIFTRSGCFSEVTTYTEGVRESIKALLDRIEPQRIGINYSINNPAADGLSHGMYMLLNDYLEGTPYPSRLVSAESACAKLRSRKTETEIERLRRAAEMANSIWNKVAPGLQTGMTEKDVAGLIDDEMKARGAVNSFATIVNAGDKTKPGHGLPTDAEVSRGDLVHVDFGVKLDDYCSDLQRLVYFRRPGEDNPPSELVDAFNAVYNIISATGKMCRPGAVGHEIDSLARRMLSEDGYPHYEHALGHQLGRAVHDGGGILGPKWERYGNTPEIPLEENNAFTLELEIILPGIGCVGLEEDMRVTTNGAEYLCPRQKELIVR